MKSIVLTGATGYIGATLTGKLLQLGYTVSVIVRKESRLTLLEPFLDSINIYKDDGSLDGLIGFFQKIKSDAVIHLASLFISEHKTSDIDNLIESNIRFSTHILEAMNVAGIKNIVNTSTSWQNYHDEVYNPACLYAATKQAFEDILKFFVEAKNFNAITLTIFDTYGEGDPRNKIINLFARIAASGESLNMSKGEQYLDLIYIDDIIDAYVLAVSYLIKGDVIGSHKYFLHSDKPMRLKDIAEAYSKIKGVTLHINWGEREYRNREIMTIYSIGETLPGWSVKYSLEDGLKKMSNPQIL